MSLTTIRQERLAWLNWKDIAPMRQSLASLPSIENIHYTLGNTVTIDSSQINDAEKEAIKKCALALRPWRKGPFELFGTFIDTEWQSFTESFRCYCVNIGTNQKFKGATS